MDKLIDKIAVAAALLLGGVCCILAAIVAIISLAWHYALAICIVIVLAITSILPEKK